MTRRGLLRRSYWSAQTQEAAAHRLIMLRENWWPDFIGGYVMEGHSPGHPSHLTMPWYTVVRTGRVLV